MDAWSPKNGEVFQNGGVEPCSEMDAWTREALKAGRCSEMDAWTRGALKTGRCSKMDARSPKNGEVFRNGRVPLAAATAPGGRVRIGREILCLPYAGFFLESLSLNIGNCALFIGRLLHYKFLWCTFISHCH